MLVVLIHKQQCGSAVICVRRGIGYGRQAMTGERIRSKAKTSLWMEVARFDEAEQSGGVSGKRNDARCDRVSQQASIRVSALCAINIEGVE